MFNSPRLSCAALALGAAILAIPVLPSWAQTTQAPAAAAPAAFSELFIEMRDGTRLAANVYLPKGQGPWPVIVTRTPYLKDGSFMSRGVERYTDAGYAYVLQDVRGKGHSQGHYEAFANDTEDGYDTIEGVARQPWSNGKIGITGASAMGITANLAATAAPPHLKAADGIVAPNETFTTSFLGGVPKDKDTVG